MDLADIYNGVKRKSNLLNKYEFFFDFFTAKKWKLKNAKIRSQF
jgi:hypothetical protein